MLQGTNSCVFRLLNTMYRLRLSVSLLQPDEGFATSLKLFVCLMFKGPCIIVITEESKNQLDVT